MVEVGITELPKKKEWARIFDTDFGVLEELSLHVSLNDSCKFEIFDALPGTDCELLSFGGVSDT